MTLPNPGMDFTPFDPLPAASLDDLVENIEALYNGSAFDSGSAINSVALSNPYNFSAYVATNYSAATGGSIVSLSSEKYDTGNAFNTTTFRYVAPVNGYYSFKGASTGLLVPAVYYLVSLSVNGAGVAIGTLGYNSIGGAFDIGSNVAKDLQLTAGDYVQLGVNCNQGGSFTVRGDAAGANTYLTGYLISRT